MENQIITWQVSLPCNEEEVWKVVVGWDNYAVSTHGRVYSFRFASFMQPQKVRKNTEHRKIRMSNNGNWKGIYVHRLVAIAFIPNPNNKAFINHIDGNPANNHVENLEWCTPKENTQHSYNMGFQKMPTQRARGEQRSKRLKDADVLAIKQLLLDKVSHSKIAGRFSVTSSTISAIGRGLTWNHISILSLITAGIAIQS